MKNIGIASVAAMSVAAMLAGCENVFPIEGRYVIQGDNGDVVLDTVTGLEWERCSMGQDWNGSTCIRAAHAFHSGDVERMLKPSEVTFSRRPYLIGDQPPWRIPTKDELRTLVFCSNGNPARFKDSDERCYGDHQIPTIVLRAFPNTPRARFLSSTPSDRSTLPHFWSVDFSNGQADTLHSRGSAIRRVRDGQQR